METCNGHTKICRLVRIHARGGLVQQQQGRLRREGAGELDLRWSPWQGRLDTRSSARSRKLRISVRLLRPGARIEASERAADGNRSIVAETGAGRRICRPTATLSITGRSRNRRMFWKVRAIPSHAFCSGHGCPRHPGREKRRGRRWAGRRWWRLKVACLSRWDR